ncbi:MAG TPA: nucleotide exchange factor GrpE [Alphaproteobacteria bacterium]|nr:nucleotide exchange factor GrpE [Alphaproteobacteria bacterium]
MNTDDTQFTQEQPMTLEACRAALASARQESAELREKYLRAAAAVENARKQAERVATARINDRLQKLFARLLEVPDNLERALSFAAEDDPLVPGVRATLRQLLDVLRREGVVPIEIAPGAPFDPRFHEAVETRTGDVAELTVAEVMQPGYMFEDQVLRPARVVVTRPAPDAA